MADTKITALASISTSTDPAVDPLVIVDVSDTSMAASGTSKKVTLNNLLSSSPTATGAFSVTGLVTAGSAAITGDLTVDTSTLKVDSTNNRVGIKQASPSHPFQIGTTDLILDAAGNVGIAVTPSAWTGGVKALDMGSGGLGLFSNGGITVNAFFDSTDARWEYKTNGPATFYNLQTGVHQWFVAASGTANNPITTFATAAMELNASGNLVFPSGKGIDFSAVTGGTGTATGNVLNDYEEGTFTLGLTFGGGNTGMTGSRFYGRYTKIGRAVTITGIITLTAKGSSTGDALLTGLPFASSSGDGSFTAISLRLSNVTFTNSFQGFIGQGATTVNLEQITNAGVDSKLTHSNFSNSSLLIVNFTYDV